MENGITEITLASFTRNDPGKEEVAALGVEDSHHLENVHEIDRENDDQGHNVNFRSELNMLAGQHDGKLAGEGDPVKVCLMGLFGGPSHRRDCVGALL